MLQPQMTTCFIFANNIFKAYQTIYDEYISLTAI